MNRHIVTQAALVLALFVLGAGCLKDSTLDPNRAPEARARAVGNDGKKVVDESVDGGADALTFDFDGEAVEVTLDGRNSVDLDGEVVAFDWRYLAPTSDDDGGVSEDGYWGQFPELDPKDVARPKVRLPMGEHTFVLWVRDDDGAISTPDTITVRIGVDPVEQCVAGVFEEIDDTCAQCVCSQGASCVTAVPTCDGACWGLIGCIATSCPTFTMDMDTQCVVDNCAAFLSGSAGATAAGSCVGPCAAECTPSITAIITGG